MAALLVKKFLAPALCAGLGCWTSACDHGLEAEPEGLTGIAGRVTFVGSWPEEVGQVAVAVYEDLPRTLTDLFNLRGTDTEVELNSRTYDYFVPIERDGLYQWVVVAWRKEDSFWDFTALLGCYHASGDTLPGPVSVRRGEITQGVDITVDFGVLQGETVPGHAVCMRALPVELVEQASSP